MIFVSISFQNILSLNQVLHQDWFLAPILKTHELEKYQDNVEQDHLVAMTNTLFHFESLSDQ